MAATISSGDPPHRHEGWIWFGLDRLDTYPGTPVPGAPSHLFRYVIDAGVRIDFLVTHPIVRNGLKLIAVT